MANKAGKENQQQMGLMIRTQSEIDLIAKALDSLKATSPGSRTVVLEDLRKRVSALQTYFKSLVSLEAIKKAATQRNERTRKMGPAYE